jgi:hypothetical protein
MSLGGILALGGFLIVLLILVSIALYLLLAFGLFKMGEKEKIEYSWLAFIPIAQLYVMGKLIKEIKLFRYVIPRHELVLPIAPLVYIILSKVPLIGFLLWLATAVLEIAALYYLYKRYKGENAIIMTVLSCVLFFMAPIFIFTMRDATPLDAAEKP